MNQSHCYQNMAFDELWTKNLQTFISDSIIFQIHCIVDIVRENDVSKQYEINKERTLLIRHYSITSRLIRNFRNDRYIKPAANHRTHLFSSSICFLSSAVNSGLNPKISRICS